MASNSVEVWESTLGGVTSHGAYGPRDVIIISSNDSFSSNQDVVPRNEGKLTEEDESRLTSEGIPSECWLDDLQLMKARFFKEKQRFEVAVVLDKQHLKKEHVLRKISELLIGTNKPGVVINYIGPGKHKTGDWCFEDGFITFANLVDLYTEHFRGKSMELCCDCSYSGNWVEEAKDFMDGAGIQPCGHSARETGMMFKVRASCRPNQIGSSLYYSLRGRANDKNTGTLTVYHSKNVAQDQTTYGIDFTRITCKREVDDLCALSPSFTFKQQRDMDRIYLVRGKDRGKAAWHYVLLVDDAETQRLFKEKVAEGTVDVADYGLVLKSGWGKDPPQKVLDWIDKVGMGLEPLHYS